MRDVPYASLLDRPTSFSGRQSLPETAGVYAWWIRDDITGASGRPRDVAARALYIGAAANIAAAVTADALSMKTTNLRMGLATVMAEQLGLRPRKDTRRSPLNISEHQRMDHWISAHLLLSWAELPQPAAYRDALVRALDPQLKS